MPREKPEIGLEARGRILDFVRAIEAAEKHFGVVITADEGNLVLFDVRREDKWIMSDGTEYGDWDAFIFATEEDFPSAEPGKVEFEDFDGWDK